MARSLHETDKLAIAATSFIPLSFSLGPRTIHSLAQRQGIPNMEGYATKPVIETVKRAGGTGIPYTSFHAGWGRERERKEGSGSKVLLIDRVTCASINWGSQSEDDNTLETLQRQAQGAPIIVHSPYELRPGRILEVYDQTTVKDLERITGRCIRTLDDMVDALNRMRDRDPNFRIAIDTSERRLGPFGERLGFRHRGDALTFVTKALPHVAIHHVQIATSRDWEAIAKPDRHPEIRAITALIPSAESYRGTVLELHPGMFAAGLGRNVRTVVEFVRNAIQKG